MNFKDINIGKLIEERVNECNISLSYLSNFFKCSEKEIKEIFESKTLNCDLLLIWCKILEYDFFRIYSHHIILYSPPSNKFNKKDSEKSALPNFRKNIYTKEIIDFILEQIKSGNMTRAEVLERYKIPKTTLYKWINKYSK